MANKKSKEVVVNQPIVFGKKLKLNDFDAWDVGPDGCFGELIERDGDWVIGGIAFSSLRKAERHIERSLKQLFKRVGLG